LFLSALVETILGNNVTLTKVLEKRHKCNFVICCFNSDESLIKDVITPGSELLQTMAVELNREDVPGVKNWTHLASRLEVPSDVLREFAGESTVRKSPTKEVIQWLADRFPDTTLIDLVQALEKIQRNDAIQIITKQFPDAVG